MFKPRIVENFRNTGAICKRPSKKSVDDSPTRCGDLGQRGPGEGQATLLVQNMSTATSLIKRHLPNHEDIEDDTNSPGVRLQRLVRLTQEDLRRRVRLRATVRAAQV